MKIIDWERKGNLIRFILGNEDLKDWWGDDWNDVPYQHNAGRVYDKFISGYKVIVVPWEYNVYEPKDFGQYSKNDMKSRNIPMLIITKEYLWDAYQKLLKKKEDLILIYMGDDPSKLSKLVVTDLL